MLVAYFPKRKEFGNIIELVKIKNVLSEAIQLRISELNTLILSKEDKNNSIHYIIKDKIFNFLANKIDITKYRGDNYTNYILTFNYNNQDELNDLETILTLLTQNDLELAKNINNEAIKYQTKYNQIIKFSSSIGAILSKKAERAIYDDIIKITEIDKQLISQYQEIFADILNSLKVVNTINKEKKEVQLTDKQKQNIQQLEEYARKAGYQGEFDQLNILGTINNIEEWMFKQNHYIELAYAMKLVRDDWSDGVDVVENALDNFKYCNLKDHKIYTEIKKCLQAIENLETDGRVFRDCEYDYITLFSLVENPSLVDLAIFLTKLKFS